MFCGYCRIHQQHLKVVPTVRLEHLKGVIYVLIDSKMVESQCVACMKTKLTILSIQLTKWLKTYSRT